MSELKNLFWNNFIAVHKEDKENSDQLKTHDALLVFFKSTKLDLKPVRSTSAEYYKYEENVIQARKQALANGWIMPDWTLNRGLDSKLWQAMCIWCQKSIGINSTYMKNHLLSCKCCPDSVKTIYSKDVASSSTFQKRSGEQLRHSVDSHANDRNVKAKGTDLREHVAFKMNTTQVSTADEMLSRVLYKFGWPFRSVLSKEFRDFISYINPSYSQQTSISDWNIRNGLLDKEYCRIEKQNTQLIADATSLSLISDGWSGIQKVHKLNILLTTPTPLFIKNIDTGEASVTAEYQVNCMLPILEEYQKIRAIVTGMSSCLAIIAHIIIFC